MGWDGGGETARETENLAAWGGESGRGPARGAGIRGAGAAEFPKADPHELTASGSYRLIGVIN